MLDAATTADLRQFAFAVAPELAASPLYILSGSQVDHLPFKRDWRGLAIPGDPLGRCDYNLRATIGDAWVGRGNIIILDVVRITEEAVSAEAVDGCLRHVLLHEAAHCLPARYLSVRDCADVFDCALVREHQRQQLAVAESLKPPVPGTPESGHDLAFFRRLVHLWTRATVAGWDVPADQIFGGDFDFVPPMPQWVVSLLPELFRLRSASFTQIEATPPPEAFNALWQYTLQCHQHPLCEVPV